MDYVNVFKYMKKALTEYATGDDGTEFPAKDIDQLIGYIDGTIDEADSFLLSLDIDLEKIIADSNTLDKLDALRSAYDTIVAKDDDKEKFKVILNTLANLYEASKPEIFEKSWSNDKFAPLTIITLCVSIFSLSVACIIGKDSNCISYDVSMALLGSAVLGFIMSLTEYYVEKRKAMEEFWLQSNKILKELRKIKYLELDAPVELIKDALLEEQANYWNAKFPLLIDDSGITHKAKSALISWFEENIPMSFNEDSDIEAELEKYYSASLKTYKDTFLRCMRSYQDASSIDLGLIDNAYGNLDFIISNHSIRKYAYNNIFDKMRKFVYQFREEAYHFDLLNDGKGNFAVCVSKVVDLNKLFFAAKDVKAHGYVNTLVYQTAFDEIESELEKFRCKIYKTKYVPVKSSPISGMMRYFGEDSETKGTDE